MYTFNLVHTIELKVLQRKIVLFTQNQKELFSEIIEYLVLFWS